MQSSKWSYQVISTSSDVPISIPGLKADMRYLFGPSIIQVELSKSPYWPRYLMASIKRVVYNYGAQSLYKMKGTKAMAAVNHQLPSPSVFQM